jgi:hypothetical protein
MSKYIEYHGFERQSIAYCAWIDNDKDHLIFILQYNNK